MIPRSSPAVAVCALFVFFAVVPLSAQQPAAPGNTYVVELDEVATAVDEPIALAAELARTYGGQLEIDGTTGRFAFVMTPERARLLAADSRVKAVREEQLRISTPEPSNVPQPAEQPASIPGDVAAEGTPLGNIYVGPYKYDAAGNVIHMGGDRFTYDRMGRLTSGTAHTTYNNKQTFTYDGFGNLKNIYTDYGTNLYIDVDWQTNKLKSSAGSETGTNVVHTWAGSSGYDAAGNQTKVNGGTYVYAYDSLNALTRLSGPRTELYIYDGHDERVAVVNYISSSAATWRYTLRDAGGSVLRELTDSVSAGVHSWRFTKDYVYRNGALLAAVEPVSGGGDRRTHFHLDHLGSPVLITDDNGERMATHKYWPFGADAPGTDADSERMKFTGHERDVSGTDTNVLDYMHARFYRPASGRFLSVDPAAARFDQPQSWNRYAYVLNNPMNKIDPTGKYDIDCVPGGIDCEEEKKKFEEVRQHALSDSDERVKAAAAVYGNPGEQNGVHVLIGNETKDKIPLKPGVAGQVGVQPDYNNGKATLLAFVTIRPGQTGTNLEATVAHEGTHILTGKAFFATMSFSATSVTWDLAKNMTEFQTEFNAYQVSAAVYRRANMTRDLCNNCNYDIGKGVSPAQTDAHIKQYLADPNQAYHVTPQNPGDRQVGFPYNEAPPK